MVDVYAGDSEVQTGRHRFCRSEDTVDLSLVLHSVTFITFFVTSITVTVISHCVLIKQKFSNV